jgi:hypothetical protein
VVAPDPLATVVVVCHTHHITSRCALLTFSWPLRGPSGSTIDRTVSDRSCAPRCLGRLRHASRLTQLTRLPPPPPGHPQALPRVQQERRQARATTGTAAAMAGAGGPTSVSAFQAAERALAQTRLTDSASISVLPTHRETRRVSLHVNAAIVAPARRPVDLNSPLKPLPHALILSFHANVLR